MHTVSFNVLYTTVELMVSGKLSVRSIYHKYYNFIFYFAGIHFPFFYWWVIFSELIFVAP